MELKMFDCGSTILLIFQTESRPIFRIRLTRARMLKLGNQIQTLLGSVV